MSFLNFSAGEVYQPNSNGIITVPVSLPTLSIRKDSIESVFYQGASIPYVYLTYTNNATSAIAYVSKKSLAIQSLLSDTDFIFIPASVIISSNLNQAQHGAIVNHGKLFAITPNGAHNGIETSTISFSFNHNLTSVEVYTAWCSRITNSDAVVEPQPATEFIFVNSLSLCYDITVVNHATGATNTIHTPLTGADYSIDEDRYIVPFGGFMVVFSSNIPGPGTYIYFIDNDGNLVDQIVGAGPGYDWGEIDYRLVWGADFDATGSVLKIFDGKNVRTHEFPFTAGFDMNPWSEGEGDSSKNLYVPFLVYDGATLTNYLYLSTPGGGLIDLDYDSWYDNEVFSVIHPTSDKLFRSTEGPNGFNVLEVYTEDGIKINSLDLASYNVNDYNDRNYYGANGDFVTAFYNYPDNTVPYLFVAYKAATNTFVTFTSETAVNGYSLNYIDHELYDRNVSAANVLTLIIGVSSSSAINGMADWSAGSTIHWVPANGTSWQSFENNNGDAFSLSYTEGYFGTYPLFITTQDSLDGNLWALLLGEDSSTIANTGIATADTFSVDTSCLHDYTYARISITNLPANLVSWQIYSDTALPATFTTGPNTFSNQEGGTIVVLDTDNSGNNWSWTTAAVNTVGDIIVPAATDSFEIAGNNSGGYWNPWGYSTNGKQVLIDKDGLDQVVGFYFLTEDSTAWTYMPNAWDDGTGRAWEKGLNNFAFMTWSGGLFAAGGYVYMNYDIATGAFISGGTSEILTGGNFGINAIGDRQSARTELPVSGDYEHNCFTAAGIVKVTTPSNYDIAFNDAYWSWD